jgi:hypothetical protein
MQVTKGVMAQMNREKEKYRIPKESPTRQN